MAPRAFLIGQPCLMHLGQSVQYLLIKLYFFECGFYQRAICSWQHHESPSHKPQQHATLDRSTDQEDSHAVPQTLY